MKLIRFIVGRIILLLDFLTRPSPVIRSREDQDSVDAAVTGLSLYQFKACPFCVKVRRELKRHSLNIELRDAQHNVGIKAELTSEGGCHKVPCLRIEKPDNSVEWLYESNDIIAYLKTQFNLA